MVCIWKNKDIGNFQLLFVCYFLAPPSLRTAHSIFSPFIIMVTFILIVCIGYLENAVPTARSARAWLSLKFVENTGNCSEIQTKIGSWHTISGFHNCVKPRSHRATMSCDGMGMRF